MGSSAESSAGSPSSAGRTRPSGSDGSKVRRVQGPLGPLLRLPGGGDVDGVALPGHQQQHPDRNEQHEHEEERLLHAASLGDRHVHVQAVDAGAEAAAHAGAAELGGHEAEDQRGAHLQALAEEGLDALGPAPQAGGHHVEARGVDRGVDPRRKKAATTNSSTAGVSEWISNAGGKTSAATGWPPAPLRIRASKRRRSIQWSVTRATTKPAIAQAPMTRTSELADA